MTRLMDILLMTTLQPSATKNPHPPHPSAFSPQAPGLRPQASSFMPHDYDYDYDYDDDYDYDYDHDSDYDYDLEWTSC